jgi:hypothetical protein
MKRPTYYVEIHSPNEDHCIEALIRVPRGCNIYCPVPTDKVNFVNRIRGKLYRRGMIVRSRETNGKLRLWAWTREWDRKPEGGVL